MTEQTRETEIAIIGAGMAGTSAALALARLGHGVALIDTHAAYPPDFRAEKLGDPQVALLQRLGLDAAARSVLTPMDDILVYRFGRPVRRERRREYGFAYADLVNALRAELGGEMLRVGRVAAIEAGPERQAVTLNDGSRIEARLLVVATGLGDTVRRQVGIGRETISRTHSLSIGFDLARPAAAHRFQTLTYYGFRAADRMAYVTFFPIGETMRVNLFVYREPGEAWTKAFRKAPAEHLRRLAPELSPLLGDFATAGAVELRPIDLVEARDHVRDGVVLIGDAFRTPCPVVGHGLERTLTDAVRLAHYAPLWLATPGMGAAKLAEFYADAEKRAADEQSTRLALYSRSIAVDPRLPWRLRRLRNRVVRKGLYGMGDMWNRLRHRGFDREPLRPEAGGS
ncbi:monooxygenase FAD-binding protein [Aureimonas endophytica]|uniref:Monooxygenase FAD-binding protein n=1 Tax=Aureimonas endophytica TaxID=2027858 RepID=A0A916ZRN7_9HYPH|nr:NAD(P)/FAD-dependent oxidoreductase [Aureimonas endophytica]GGE10616.1 monooxygenase FAD-binding protein [Aureimonas endophytica]